MIEILAKEELTPVTKSFLARPKAVARRARTGQFVIGRQREE